MIHPDPWLSSILGREALRIDVNARVDDMASLTRRLSSEALFVTAKVPTREPAIVREFENIGFRVVDTALIFRSNRLLDPEFQGARFAELQDRARIVDIAGSAFKYSRFHIDPDIPNALANRIKAEWASNYFAGRRGDAMITIETDGQVAGFLLLLEGDASKVVIDLIAVDPSFERRGLARSMINFAANHGIGDGVKPTGILVGTQVANTPSVNLYEAAGFRLEGSSFVLHHHGVGASYEQPEFTS